MCVCRILWNHYKRFSEQEELAQPRQYHRQYHIQRLDGPKTGHHCQESQETQQQENMDLEKALPQLFSLNLVET